MHLLILAAVAVVAIGALNLLIVCHSRLNNCSALIKVKTVVQRARSPLSRVPGPWYSRWTSSIARYQWLRGQRAVYVQRLHEKYGNFPPFHARRQEDHAYPSPKAQLSVLVHMKSTSRPYLEPSRYIRLLNHSPKRPCMPW